MRALITDLRSQFMAWRRRRALANFPAARLFARAKRHLPRALHHWLERQDAYEAWQNVNRLSAAAEQDLIETLIQWEQQLPKISVVMPVYKPALPLLEAAIASVCAQLYSDWELCLVDDGSGDAALTERLASLCAAEPRICLTSLPENGGISAATNAGIARSTGQIIVFLDQDDLITRDCLAEFALAFAEDPACDLAYSDSDKINTDGKRIAPSFKPGWSPTLLLSHMYLSHAVAIRRTLIAKAGVMRSEFDGSQDFDFALRASEQARTIRHIPKILYHWRMIKGSTAISASAKPHSIEAGQRAVCEAIARRGIAARVVRRDWAERGNIGLFDLEFPRATASLSVVVTNCQDIGSAQNVIDVFDGHHSLIDQLIFADFDLAATAIGSVNLRSFSNSKILSLSDFGPTASNSAVQDHIRADTKSENVLFFNAWLKPSDANWLDQMIGFLGLSGVGAVGARLLARDGRVAHAGLGYLDTTSPPVSLFAGLAATHSGFLYRARATHESAAVSADCLLTPRALLLASTGVELGAADAEISGAAYCNTLRLQGRSVLVCARAELRFERDRPKLDRRRAHGIAAPDPYYNANLTRHRPYHQPAMRTHRMRAKRPVHVAFVTHSLEHEGAQTTLFDLISGLVADGTVVATLFSPRDGPLAAAYHRLGIAVHFYEASTRKADRHVFAEKCAALGKAFRAARCEVVVANTLETYIAVEAARRENIAALWCHHESGHWKTYFNKIAWPARGYAYAAFGYAYRVIFVAEATRAGWLALSTRDNFEVVRHAIAPAVIAANRAQFTRSTARAELAIGEQEIVLLQLGSVCARKGQIDLIRAFAAIADSQIQNIRVLIVGAFVETKYHAMLLAEIAKLDAPRRARVTLTGAVASTALYYAAADIFVCCSRMESAPRVLLEAMAFALPIITTPVDGIPEMVVEHHNALFYAPADLGALESQICRLIETPQLRSTLGSNGPAVFESVSNYPEMLAKFGALIDEAAATSNLVAGPLASLD